MVHTVDEATDTSSRSSARPEDAPLAWRLAAFFREAAHASWDGMDFGGDDIQDAAVKFGLYKCEPYDLDKHGESDWADPGDDWYTFADDVRALLSDGALERQDDASPPHGMPPK